MLRRVTPLLDMGREAARKREPDAAVASAEAAVQGRGDR